MIYLDLSNILELGNNLYSICNKFSNCNKCDIYSICFNMRNKKIKVKNNDISAEDALTLIKTFINT